MNSYALEQVSSDIQYDAPFYAKASALREGLRWLTRVYRAEDGGSDDPISQYSYIKRMLLGFRVMRILLVSFTVIGYYIVGLSFLGTIFWLIGEKTLNGSGLVASTYAIMIMAIVVFVPFHVIAKTWVFSNKLIKGFIGYIWTTRGFKDEIRDLLRLVGEVDDNLEWFVGKGVEVASNSIPVHVIEKCQASLLAKAMEVKRIEFSEDKDKPIFGTAKAVFKRLFDLCRRFGIIEGHADPRSYYIKAEEKVKRELKIA